MQFKSKIDESKLQETHKMLQEILNFVDKISLLMFKKEILVTSLFRPKTDDSGVHALGRAADIRTVDYFTTKQITVLVFLINSMYVYDAPRLNYNVALYHRVEGNTWHIHIQVHDNTKIIW